MTWPGLFPAAFLLSSSALGQTDPLGSNPLVTFFILILGGLLAGLPSAMAAKLVHPDRKMLAVCGDGGFMMNSQDLKTAVRLKIDLVVLILNDSSYGMIRWKQAHMGFKDFGLQFNNPDFVAYANSYGATGHRIERSQDLVPVLDQCYAHGGVHVIDLPVDYSLNGFALFEEIPRDSAQFQNPTGEPA
ncbi:MAG: thiamine pyrophosphate-dependent enzyme [Kiritimatiellia bacterium]